jgi:hypothetical protein
MYAKFVIKYSKEIEELVSCSKNQIDLPKRQVGFPVNIATS